MPILSSKNHKKRPDFQICNYPDDLAKDASVMLLENVSPMLPHWDKK